MAGNSREIAYISKCARKSAFLNQIAIPGMTISEAAARSRISRSTLYRWYRTDSAFFKDLNRVLKEKTEREIQAVQEKINRELQDLQRKDPSGSVDRGVRGATELRHENANG